MPGIPAMLATLGGVLALVLGLSVLLLPLAATELSRPRDSFWGAVVLLLGLVLVTSAERLSGAPMLGVLCGGLLIGRLGLEVGQARWRLLSDEERQRLWSRERWQTSLLELMASADKLLQITAGLAAGLGSWMQQRRQPRSSGKRWVRQDPADVRTPASTAASTTVPGDDAAVASPADGSSAQDQAEGPPATSPQVVEVSSLEDVETLLAAAADPPAAKTAADVPPEETGASDQDETG